MSRDQSTRRQPHIVYTCVYYTQTHSHTNTLYFFFAESIWSRIDLDLLLKGCCVENSPIAIYGQNRQEHWHAVDFTPLAALQAGRTDGRLLELIYKLSAEAFSLEITALQRALPVTLG